MFVVTNEEILLSSIEIVELAGFLRTSTGRKTLEALVAMRPPIAKDKFGAGRASGYEEAIANLITMAAPAKSTSEDVSTNYPDLDDDAAWKEQIEQPKENAE